MTPIRETIARAISVGHAHGEPDMPWHPQGSNREDAFPLWQWFQVDADAVLRALDEAGCVVVPRDASEAMVEAHMGECAGDADEAGPDRVRKAWRAMISAHTGQDSNGADVSVPVVE